MFALGRKSEQARETRLVNLAHRAFAVRLNPFGMFLPQRVVDLALKVNVFLDFARTHWRSIRFHHQDHRKQSRDSEDACAGF